MKISLDSSQKIQISLDELTKLGLTFYFLFLDLTRYYNSLTHFCIPDEKAQILGKAREYADETARSNPGHVIYQASGVAVPEQNPQWVYKDRRYQLKINRILNHILEGMRKYQTKPVNYNKVKEITQEGKDNSAVYLNRLPEAFTK